MNSQLYFNNNELSPYYIIDSKIYIRKEFKIKGDFRDMIIEIKNSNSVYLKEIRDIELISDYTMYFEEYIDGVKLNDINFSKLSNEEIKNIMIQTLFAIRDLHNLNIIHRDIKPDNIIIDKNSHITLIDYDVARKKSSTTRDTILLGTEQYASPEHFGFGQTTNESDIYSFGKTFKELLGDNSYFDYLLDKCVEVSPDDRYHNTSELINILQDKVSINLLFSTKFYIIVNLITLCFFIFLQYGEANDSESISNISLISSTLICCLITYFINSHIRVKNKSHIIIFKVIYILIIGFFTVLIAAIIDSTIIELLKNIFLYF